MKKIFAALVLWLVVVGVAAAKDIVVTADGKTEAEARKNALVKISRQFSLDFLSVTNATEKSNGTKTTKAVTQQVQTSTQLSLFGYTINYEAKNDVVQATVTFSEKSLPLYQNEIARLEKTIASLDSERKKENAVLEQKLAATRSLMECVATYENYVTIAEALGDTTKYKMSLTSDGVKKDYTYLIMEYPTDLTRQLAELEKIKNDDERRRTRQRIIDEQNTLNNEKLLYEAKIRAQQQAELDAMDETQKKLLADMNTKNAAAIAQMKTNRANSDRNWRNVIEQIEANKKQYNEIRVQFKKTYASETARLAAERDSKLKEANERQYGNLAFTPIQINELRTVAVNNIKKEYAQIIEDRQSQIADDEKKQLSAIMKLLEADLKDLKNTTFSLESVSNEANISVGSYNRTTKSWPYFVTFVFEGQEKLVTGDISYKVLTGKSPPGKNAKAEALQEYESSLIVHDAFLAEKNAIHARVEYFINPVGFPEPFYRFQPKKVIITSITSENALDTEKKIDDITFTYYSPKNGQTLETEHNELKRLALAGYAGAQKEVGDYYYSGDTVKKNLWTSTRYYNKALKNGYDESRDIKLLENAQSEWLAFSKNFFYSAGIVGSFGGADLESAQTANGGGIFFNANYALDYVKLGGEAELLFFGKTFEQNNTKTKYAEMQVPILFSVATAERYFFDLVPKAYIGISPNLALGKATFAGEKFDVANPFRLGWVIGVSVDWRDLVSVGVRVSQNFVPLNINVAGTNKSIADVQNPAISFVISLGYSTEFITSRLKVPSSLSLSPTGKNSARLRWKSVSNAKQYIIYLGQSENFSIAKEVQTVGKTSSATINNLPKGSNYLWVQAVFADGTKSNVSKAVVWNVSE